jgi:hypothetical protein
VEVPVHSVAASWVPHERHLEARISH